MESAGKNILWALTSIISTAVLVYFGTGLHPWWPCMWFAGLPVLLFVCRSSAWSAGVAAFVAWGLGGLNMWPYFSGVLHVSAGTQIVIFTMSPLWFVVAAMLFRALVRRKAFWSATFAFPAAWIAFEYVINLISPHGTFGSYSYSQLNFLPILQVASVTGPWGISFLLFLASAGTAAAAIAWDAVPKTPMRIVVLTWGVIAAVAVFGAIRLRWPQAGPKVKVGLIASDAQGNRGVVDRGGETERLMREYATHAEALASRGAQVIVMPEKIGVLAHSEAENIVPLFQSIADKTKSTLVIGTVNVVASREYNRAQIFRPGMPMLTYDKHHMLPPFESALTPGETLTTLTEPSGIWGVEICKDMDFTPLSRRYGKRAVGLMLVPAWDFDMDRWSHGHMAVMRGVESGFSIVRAAKQGYLTVSDNRGRILAETQSDSAAFATLLAEVPVKHDGAIYVLAGDWFAWLAIAILVLTTTPLFRKA